MSFDITIHTNSAFDGTVKFLNERKAQQERSTISNALRFFRVIKHARTTRYLIYKQESEKINTNINTSSCLRESINSFSLLFILSSLSLSSDL